MIYIALIILALLTATLYCCVIVAGRYDDAMGYDDERKEDGRKID